MGKAGENKASLGIIHPAATIEDMLSKDMTQQ
jgi:hypothetical protein